MLALLSARRDLLNDDIKDILRSLPVEQACHSPRSQQGHERGGYQPLEARCELGRVLRHLHEGSTRRFAGRSTRQRRAHPRQRRARTVGVAVDRPVECARLAGGEMRADIAQKAEKSRVTDVRVLRHSELAPENGTLALTR